MRSVLSHSTSISPPAAWAYFTVHPTSTHWDHMCGSPVEECMYSHDEAGIWGEDEDDLIRLSFELDLVHAAYVRNAACVPRTAAGVPVRNFVLVHIFSSVRIER